MAEECRDLYALYFYKFLRSISFCDIMYFWGNVIAKIWCIFMMLHMQEEKGILCMRFPMFWTETQCWHSIWGKGTRWNFLLGGNPCTHVSPVRQFGVLTCCVLIATHTNLNIQNSTKTQISHSFSWRVFLNKEGKKKLSDLCAELGSESVPPPIKHSHIKHATGTNQDS